MCVEMFVYIFNIPIPSREEYSILISPNELFHKHTVSEQVIMIVSLTRLEKLCLCAFVVGVGVFVMGFSVPYWVTFPSSTSRFGLWELCSTEGAGTCCFSTLSQDFRILGERLPGIWHWFAA